MGTYLSFPRTCGSRLRLFALVIVFLRSALATEPLLHALDLNRAKITRGQKIAENAWATGDDNTAATTVPAATHLSEKLAWFVGVGDAERQAQQWQQERRSSSMTETAEIAPVVPAVSAEGYSGEEVPAPHRLRHSHQRLQPYHRSSAAIAASREYFLYNSCSRRHVRMLDSGVDADGGREDEAARLVLESIGSHVVRIRSQQTGHYLCFNHKGSLVAEVEPTELCIFNETLTESHYTELHLIAGSTRASTAAVMFGSDWLIGFRKSGKPWRGYDHKLGRSRRCFQFTKRQMLRSHDDAAGRTQSLAEQSSSAAVSAAAAAAAVAGAATEMSLEPAAAPAADRSERGSSRWSLRDWPDSATAVPTASGT